MATDVHSHALGGIGFWPLLGLLFIALKLCGVIKWSWLLVLAPLWCSLGVTLLALGLLLLYRKGK